MVLGPWSVFLPDLGGLLVLQGVASSLEMGWLIHSCCHPLWLLTAGWCVSKLKEIKLWWVFTLTVFTTSDIVVLLLLCLSPWFSLTRAFSHLPSQTRMIVVVIRCFFMQRLVLRFFGTCDVPIVTMAWWHYVWGLKATIVDDLVLVLNFTMPWIVDGMAWI